MSADDKAVELHPLVQRGDTVYLVGGKKADAFADVYAVKEDAEKAILGYIFDDKDEHWIGKLNAEQRCILWTLKTNNTAFEVILNFYNSVASCDDQWILTTASLR